MVKWQYRGFFDIRSKEWYNGVLGVAEEGHFGQQHRIAGVASEAAVTEIMEFLRGLVVEALAGMV